MAVIVKLGADISEVEKKAEEIPGVVDRAVRKGKSKNAWEGQGAEGSASDYAKLAGMSREIELQRQKDEENARKAEQQAAEEAQAARDRAKKEEMDKYEMDVKWNSKLQEDKDKEAKAELERIAKAEKEKKAADERAAKEEQAAAEKLHKEQMSDYELRLRWNSKLQEDSDRAAADEEAQEMADYKRRLVFNSKVVEEQIAEAERAAAAEQARKEKERKQANDDFVKRVKWNSKIQEDKDKAAAAEEKERKRQLERQANAKDWSDKFIDNIAGGLMRTIGPWAIAIKGVQLAIQMVNESLERIKGASQASATIGMRPQSLFDIQTAARKTGGNQDEIGGMVINLQEKLAKGALGVDPEGIKAISLLKSLGMDITMEKVRSGAVDAGDAIKFLADKYGDLTGNAEGAMMMSQLFGAEYMKLVPIMRNGSRGIEELGGSFTASQTEIQSTRDFLRFWGDAWETVTNKVKRTFTGGKSQTIANTYQDYREFQDKNSLLPADQRYAKLFTTEDQGGMMKPGESRNEFDKRMKEMFADMKSGFKGSQWEDEMRQLNADILDYGMSTKELLSVKNKPSAGVPSLAIASSLQAMGGGDFASAITRGPVDMIAENTKATAEAAKETAENTKNLAPANTRPQPAIIGK